MHVYFENKTNSNYKVIEDTQPFIDCSFDKEYELISKNESIKSQIHQILNKNSLCQSNYKFEKEKKSLEFNLESIIRKSNCNNKLNSKKEQSYLDFLISNTNIKNDCENINEEINFEENNKKCLKCLKENSGIYICLHKLEPKEEEKKIKQCKDCLTDFCELCFSLCHKNCVKIKGKFKNFMVIKSADSCCCYKHIIKSNYKLECFYSNFVFKYFNLDSKKYYKSKDCQLIICNFCADNHFEKDKLEESNLKEIQFSQFICQCEDENHEYFHSLDLFEFLDNIYNQISCEIEYSDLIHNFRLELIDFMKLINNNNKYFDKIGRSFEEFKKDSNLYNNDGDFQFFIENEVTKFSVHNILYNGMLKYRDVR